MKPCNENYKTLMKDFEEDTQKILYSWTEKLMSAIHKIITNLMQYLSKYKLFTKLEKTILKFVWNTKVPQIAKTILRKKEQSRKYHIS